MGQAVAGKPKTAIRVGKAIVMFAKGRTNFQAMVEDKADSLKMLLAFVPKEIASMKARAEASYANNTEECLEWDNDLQKDIVVTNKPVIDTTIFDDMLYDFYASMVQRIYSFCEICMSELCSNASLQKRNIKKHRQTIKQRGPILASHYKSIQKENGITLPKLSEIWKGYHSFRIDRNMLTHNLLIKKYNEEFLKHNIEDVQRLLLETENAILMNKQ